MLKLLQKEIPKLWTDELYSKEFNASPSKYKDFDHALKHILKSAVKLLEMTEEADHSGAVPGAFDGTQKFLADLVICTVRLALTHPDGVIDLEEAVLDRIKRKMGVNLYSGKEEKKEPVMVKCPGSCGQMIRADWGHSCGSQVVRGICPGCNDPVPPGFYRCNGTGSHRAVAQ